MPLTTHGNACGDVLVDDPLAVREEVGCEEIDNLGEVTTSSDYHGPSETQTLRKVNPVYSLTQAAISYLPLLAEIPTHLEMIRTNA